MKPSWMKNVSNDPNSIDIEKFGQPMFPSVSNPNVKSVIVDSPTNLPRYKYKLTKSKKNLSS